MPLRDHMNRQGSVALSLPPKSIDESEEARAVALRSDLTATPVEQRKLISKSRREIQTVAEEFVSANSTDTSISPQLYSPNIMRVHTVIAQGPVGATSMTLTLGNRVYRFATGALIYWPDYMGLLKPEEKRLLTWAGANPVGGGDTFLHLIGEQLTEVNF